MLGVGADEDAPAVVPDTVEDHRRGLGRGHRRGVAKHLGHRLRALADVLVGGAGDVDALTSEALTDLTDLLFGEVLRARGRNSGRS